MKAPLTWPNSSASSSAFGKRGDVHGDHREAAARAGHVQRARDHFFPGAGFPGDQNRAVPPGDQADHLRDAPHGGTDSHQHLAPRLAHILSRPAEAGAGGSLDFGGGILVRTRDIIRAELHVADGIGQAGGGIADHDGDGPAHGKEPFEQVVDPRVGPAIGQGSGDNRDVVIDVGQAVDALRGGWAAIDQPVRGQIDSIRPDVEGSKRLGFQVLCLRTSIGGHRTQRLRFELGFDRLRRAQVSITLLV